MPVNVSPSFQAAVRRQLSREVLPITQHYLVADQFAEKIQMERGAGVTWTATRFNRLPLPQAPLSEGVPPEGQQLTISQVTGVALQWGARVIMTDVAVVTTYYNLIQQAKRLLGVQLGELQERNAYAALMGGAQVNYPGQVGARANLAPGNVIDVVTINRTFTDLENLGAPFYGGPMEPTITREIEHGSRAVKRSPEASDHYVSIVSPLTENDLRQEPQIINAWSYSDVTRLYINEIGYYAGIHFTKSNMVPHWTGNATAGNGTPGTAGNLPAGQYVVQVTGTDSLELFGEQQIYAPGAGVTVGGTGNGSISITVPNTPNYTYSVYIGTTATPTNLAMTSTTGVGSPTTGPYTSMARGIIPGATIILTGLGAYHIPPASPAIGVTVYPTFVFGNDYYACTILDQVEWMSLFDADKSDPLNQLRVVSYKFHKGYLIKNQQFGCRIESAVSNTGQFG